MEIPVLAARRGYRTLIVVGLVALVVACSSESGDRQAEVAARGAEVMPFDLESTTHTFTKNDEGGVQLVTAHDPDDADQIELIRGHLRIERDKFSRGDFHDPARIHGMDMPGLAELSAGHARIDVAYQDHPAGAELVYTTADATLVDAIHAWFDRQLMDHGSHARTG
jgi:hypothetical protein